MGNICHIHKTFVVLPGLYVMIIHKIGVKYKNASQLVKVMKIIRFSSDIALINTYYK